MYAAWIATRSLKPKTSNPFPPTTMTTNPPPERIRPLFRVRIFTRYHYVTAVAGVLSFYGRWKDYHRRLWTCDAISDGTTADRGNWRGYGTLHAPPWPETLRPGTPRGGHHRRGYRYR